MTSLNRVHLNGLRALEAASRLGSLQAVALEFGVTIGAVSQQIIKAEEQLGIQMFERTPRGLVPTEPARPILQSLSAGFRSLTEAVDLAERRDPSLLTISVAPVFAARWLVRRLDRFSALNPDIMLRMDASAKVIDLAASGVDLAIRVGQGDWPGVTAHKVLAQRVFPVASPELAAAIRSPADLAQVPVIIDDLAMFDWSVWLKAAGVPDLALSVRHRFNEASLCMDAVIAGQGVMLAWQTLACDALDQGRLAVPLPIRTETGFAHYVVEPEGRRPSAAARAFKAWMEAEIADSMARLDRFF